MAFKFRNFLDSHHIPYVEVGPNVAKGHINIQCPFCASRDPSHHLGINLANNKWGCWRDERHRGNAPERLICKLIHCSWDVATELTGRGVSSSLSDFENVINSLKSEPKVEKTRYRKKLEYPEEFKKIKADGFTYRFFNYLITKRNIRADHAASFIRMYSLRCALTGDFEDRIIIPVYRNGELVTWTGRTILNNVDLRYRALENDKSTYDITNCVFNPMDDLIDRTWIRLVFIVEGPFDAMNLDYFGTRFGASAMALFGSGISDEQRYHICEIVNETYEDPKHEPYQVCIMMDDIDISLRIQAKLGFGMVKACPEGKDPGDLSRTQIEDIVSTVL